MSDVEYFSFLELTPSQIKQISELPCEYYNTKTCDRCCLTSGMLCLKNIALAICSTGGSSYMTKKFCKAPLLKHGVDI